MRQFLLGLAMLGLSVHGRSWTVGLKVLFDNRTVHTVQNRQFFTKNSHFMLQLDQKEHTQGQILQIPTIFGSTAACRLLVPRSWTIRTVRMVLLSGLSYCPGPSRTGPFINRASRWSQFYRLMQALVFTH